MKILLISILLTISSLSFAEKKSDERLANRKATILSNIERNMEMLTKHKACVTAAESKDAIKACRKTKKAYHSEMKEKRKSNREARKSKKHNH